MPPGPACLPGYPHPLGAEHIAPRSLASLGHRYLPPSLIRQLATALLHGTTLPIPEPGLAGAPGPLRPRTGPSQLQGPDRSAARNVQHVAHPQARQGLPKGRRHPEGVVPGNPSGLEVAQPQGPLQQLQGQLRLRPVAQPLLGHTRRRTPVLVGDPTLGQIQPLSTNACPSGLT